jgi:hypothetical protein
MYMLLNCYSESIEGFETFEAAAAEQDRLNTLEPDALWLVVLTEPDELDDER